MNLPTSEIVGRLNNDRMKSTNKTEQRSQQSEINYKAIFSGAALVTPVCFNPTAEQLRAIKNIKAEYEVTEPDYHATMKDGEVYSVVSLLCKFNPNEILKLKKNEYANEVFVNYKVFLKNEDRVGAASGKTQVIDEHNQSAWIKLSGKTSLSKQIEKVQAEQDYNQYKDKDSIYKINAKTARIAKVGEVALYDLIFAMSTLDEHRINAENPAKSTTLDEFKIGEDPSKTFENICEGDVSALDMFLVTNSDEFDGSDFFYKNGVQNKLGVVLGAREKDGKLYQDILTPSPKAPNKCTFRPSDMMRQYTFGESRVAKETVENMTNADYPWASHWGGNLDFKVQLAPVAEAAVKTEVKESSDDLPF